MSKGHLKEFLGRRKDKNGQGYQDPKVLLQRITSPPSNAKVINFVSAGSNIYGTSYSTAKRHAESSKMEKDDRLTNNVFLTDKKDISFTEDDR